MQELAAGRRRREIDGDEAPGEPLCELVVELDRADPMRADGDAEEVAHFLATLGERAERLGPGDPRPVPLRSGIEEVDRLDAALARGAQQGAKRLASERDFAADASHQLRTPLTALLMRLEEIASTDDLTVVEEEANIAIGQVERLSRVVDDLMSRTRSGTFVGSGK